MSAVDLETGKAREALEELEDSKLADLPNEQGIAPSKNIKSDESVASDSSDGEKKPPKPHPKDIIGLFRYATGLDYFFMFLGTLTAIGHGISLPLLMLVFGELIDFFIYQEQSASLAACLNVSRSCGNVFQSNTTFQLPCKDDFNSSGFVGLSLSESVRTVFGDSARCLTDDEFTDQVVIYCVYFVIIAVVVFVFAYIQISFFQMACERQVRKIRLEFYRAILKQNIGWFDSNPSGELASRLNDDIEKIHDGIGDKVALFIQWISTFFGGFAIGFSKDWRLTLVLLAFTPFLAICGAIFSVLITSFANREQKEYAGAGAVAEEVLSSIRTVVAFGGEYKEADRYGGKLKEARRLGAKKGLSVGIALFFTFLFLFLVDAVAFWFGGWLISEGLSEGGNVITVFFSVLIGAFALGQAMPNLENLTSAAGASIAIFKIMERVPEIDSSSTEGEVPNKFDSTIQFNNVSFQYPSRPDVPVLQGISLKVNVGQTVALVGPSGCGKSTTMQLIQRFYDVAGGEILIGGKNIQDLNLKWLRCNLGVVSQEPVLFDTTIGENIRYGREDATEADIERAARKANAYNFISELPDGFNTLVGERGTQLSGGQKQRIAIARALVRDPKLLLLDEATSALDTESEKIVQQALDKAREGRTTIVIAHRLSTIKTADVIASVEDGKVVEMGTHSELMDNEGLYYELVTAQSFAVDEAVVTGGVGRTGSRRYRKHSESIVEDALHRQVSLQRQQSGAEEEPQVKFKRQLSKRQLSKLQEEWDKEIPEVPLSRVIKLNTPEWWIILIGLVGAAVNGCIWPAFALLFGEILEVFAKPSDEILDATHLWAGLFVILGVVSGTGVFLKVSCFTISGENLTARLRSLSFRAMLGQEIGWHDDERNSTGALTTRLANDASQVQGATGTRLGTLMETMFGMVLALVIAFVYSWVLTLVILAVIPVVMIAGIAEVKALSGHTLSNKKAIETAGKIAVDSVDNIRTVASLGLEETFYNLYNKETQKPFKRGLINSSVYGLTYAFSQATIYLMYAAIFRFGAFQVISSEDNVAHESFQDVFRVFTALIFGAISVGQAGAFAPNYTKARLSSHRIFHLLDRVPEIDVYSTGGKRPKSVAGVMEAEDVTFHYPSRPDVTVLQGLGVAIQQGQTLALVGPSGCGKSTIVSLLERFYDPRAGRLMLDGEDLRELNIRWLRSQIGIVSQEPVLFDTSIAENIRYGANFREVSDEEVVEAAKAANIHSFVESLPSGYSTNVGSKGTQLSGGQKQRIAIARALVRDPKLLLLDEATSALDTESEKIVQEALDKAREGRTSIVIAHRLSTIFNADVIAVIKDGRVVEQGTHAELLQKRGMYFKLNRFQVVDTTGDLASPAHQSESSDSHR